MSDITISNIPSQQPASSHTINLDSLAGKPEKKSKKTLIIIVSVLIVSILLGGGGFALWKYQSNKKTDINNPTASLTPTQSPTPTEAPKPKYIANPYNGTPILESEFNQIKDRPPLAVIIQNHTASRPQQGINEADVMYETLAEGGITRMMGVFWSKGSDKIISLRSARKYFVDTTGDYAHIVFMHHGYAEGDARVDVPTALRKYGVHNLGTRNDAYDRDHTCEKSKSREHCAFADSNLLWKLSANNNWANKIDDQQTLKFRDEEDQIAQGGKDVTDFKVNFSANGYNDANYGVVWKYDATKKQYLRYNSNNTAFKDSKGIQVFADVFIYQKINSYATGDNKGHIVQDIIGSGTATVMQDGKAYEVDWKKTDYKTRTKYFVKGTTEEFVFKPGKQWIAQVSKSLSYTDRTPVSTITPSSTITPTK